MRLLSSTDAVTLQASPLPSRARRRAHARGDILERERLGDVIVGAEMELADTVGHVGASVEDDVKRPRSS